MIQVLLGLFSGIAFGFVIQRVGATDANKMARSHLRKEPFIPQFMVLAVALSAVGLFGLEAAGLGRTLVLPTSLLATGLAGIIFGAGWGLAGYCPGTTWAAVGEGRMDAVFALLGGLLGTGVFAHLHETLIPLLYAPTNVGQITLRNWFDQSWLALVILLLGCSAAYCVIGRYCFRDQRAMPRPRRLAWLMLAALLAAGCGAEGREPGRVELVVPPGYQPTLEVVAGDHLYEFGPFVGYYFKPQKDMRKLKLICFNERGFYASDMPVNAKLFEGEAVLTKLPGQPDRVPHGGGRITPVFFHQAPAKWLATRPRPQDEFLHFHSTHDANGATLLGYWIRHQASETFTYDMGGRVGPGSPLYHQVRPGVDLNFARIIEFDRGERPSS